MRRAVRKCAVQGRPLSSCEVCSCRARNETIKSNTGSRGREAHGCPSLPLSSATTPLHGVATHHDHDTCTCAMRCKKVRSGQKPEGLKQCLSNHHEGVWKGRGGLRRATEGERARASSERRSCSRTRHSPPSSVTHYSSEQRSAVSRPGWCRDPECPLFILRSSMKPLLYLWPIPGPGES